jgi:glycopeptide antibiotics resistance protein
MNSKLENAENLRPAAPSRAGARAWMLAFWVLVLLSASLYPFNFSPQLWHSHFAALEFDRSLLGHSTRADLISNLLAYLPFGLLVALLLEKLPAWLRLALATLGGAGLSLTVETLQLGIAMRFASATDFLANSAAATAGAVAALVYVRAPRRGVGARLRPLRDGPVVPLLLAVWIAAQAAPFIPRLRPSRIIAVLANFPHWGLLDGTLLRSVASLVVLSALIRALFKPELLWGAFVLAVLASWLAGILFLQHSLSASDCLAFLLVLPLVAWVRNQDQNTAHRALFWMVAGLLLVGALLPWDFTSVMQPVQLVLFSDANGYANIPARIFLLIGALWLGSGSQLGLWRATVVMLAVTLFTELAQTFSSIREPDPTDLLLLLFGVLLLYAARRVDQAQVAR